MASAMNISEYSAPAGGCLLTDGNFAKRMKDTLEHGYRNFRETVALKWGRHYRINDSFKMILGRDENENNALIHYAHKDDHIMQLENERGPTLILKGYDPSKDILSIAGGMIQHFSRYKNEQPLIMKYWIKHNRNEVRHIKAKFTPENKIKEMYI